MKKYAVNFECALQKVADEEGCSVCCDPGLKWSVMGSTAWLEFELINGKTFKATNLLYESDSVKCHLGRRRIESSIRWAVARLL